MRRVAVALLAPLAVTMAVAGCGSSSSSASADNNTAVKVSGTAANAPTISIPTSKPGTKLVTKVLSKGNGRELAPTDSYLANFTVEIWRGKTHKVLFSSYKSTTSATPSPEVLPVTIGLSGLQKAMSGVHVGSRVLAVLPPKYGYGPNGNSQVGVKPDDTLVWVIDVLQAFSSTQAATGKSITSGGGTLPKVTAQTGVSPVIAIPKNNPPTKLIKTMLIQGTGAPVKAGQSIVVRYVGSIWRTGKVFNDNWPTTTSPTSPPNVFQLGQLIPAWNTGLVGVPVGSRVMLVVPPAEGYGKAGQKSAGIEPTDTLVFVIDILGVA
jgi:peptidylprolyl isomerase